MLDVVNRIKRLAVEGKLPKDEARRLIDMIITSTDIDHCDDCPLPWEAKQGAGLFTDLVNSLGDGKFNQGLDIIRSNHKFVAKWRAFEQQAGSWIIRILAIGLLSTVVYFILNLIARDKIGIGVKIP